MIKIYSLKFEESLNWESLEPLYPLLSQKTLLRVKRFTVLDDALRCALGELLVKHAISTTYQIPVNKLIFLVDSYGKPFVEGPVPIHFNISHSGQRIVCAISPLAVGIDIEKITPVDTLAISKQFFLQEEFDHLASLSKCDRYDYFFMLWTMKESYIKLVGTGLNTPLDSFKIMLNESPVKVLCPISGQVLSLIQQYPLDPDYKLSLCSKEFSFDPSITHLFYNPNAFNISSVCSPNVGGGSISLSSLFSK